MQTNFLYDSLSYQKLRRVLAVIAVFFSVFASHQVMADFFQDPGNGKCLDSSNGYVYPNPCYQNEFQKWELNYVTSYNNNPVYSIKHPLDGRCLAITKGTSNVVTAACYTGYTSQLWERIGNKFKNRFSGQCLESNDSYVWTVSCDWNQSWQDWNVVGAVDNTAKSHDSPQPQVVGAFFQDPGNGKCLDSSDGYVYPNPCYGNEFQKWNLEQILNLINVYSIKHPLDGRCLAITPGTSNVVAVTCNTRNLSQRWVRITNKFQNQHSGQCLESNDAYVWTVPCDWNQDWQDWNVWKNEVVSDIFAKHPPSIAPSGGNFFPHENLQACTAGCSISGINNGFHQQNSFICGRECLESYCAGEYDFSYNFKGCTFSNGYTKNSLKPIIFQGNGTSHKCVDVGYAADGSPVYIYDCNNTIAQKFHYDYFHHQFIWNQSNLCLDRGDFKSQLKLTYCDKNNTYQKWIISGKRDSSPKMIRTWDLWEQDPLGNRQNCMSLKENNTSNFNPIITWPCTRFDQAEMWGFAFDRAP